MKVICALASAGVVASQSQFGPVQLGNNPQYQFPTGSAGFGNAAAIGMSPAAYGGGFGGVSYAPRITTGVYGTTFAPPTFGGSFGGSYGGVSTNFVDPRFNNIYGGGFVNTPTNFNLGGLYGLPLGRPVSYNDPYTYDRPYDNYRPMRLDNYRPMPYRPYGDEFRRPYGGEFRRPYGDDFRRPYRPYGDDYGYGRDRRYRNDRRNTRRRRCRNNRRNRGCRNNRSFRRNGNNDNTDNNGNPVREYENDPVCNRRPVLARHVAYCSGIGAYCDASFQCPGALDAANPTQKCNGATGTGTYTCVAI